MRAIPSDHLRRNIMKTLTIEDLPFNDAAKAGEGARSLSPEEMKRVGCGRAISVLVDGRPGGSVDDFALNMEIFKGNIGGPMVL
jgi:hypothetical protein